MEREGRTAVASLPWKYAAFFLGLCVLLYGFYSFTQRGYVTMLLLYVASIGVWGNFLLILCYVVVSFPVPMGSTPLSLSSGFLYGIGWGYLTCTVGSMIGVSFSFFICRRFLRDCVTSSLPPSPTFTALLGALNSQGFKLCACTRLAPIPLGIQNAVFALSKVKFRVYFLASWLGLFPEQLLIVYCGSTMKDISQVVSGEGYSSTEQLLVTSQLIIGILVMGFVAIQGRNAFLRALKEAEENKLSETTMTV